MNDYNTIKAHYLLQLTIDIDSGKLAEWILSSYDVNSGVEDILAEVGIQGDQSIVGKVVSEMYTKIFNAPGIEEQMEKSQNFIDMQGTPDNLSKCRFVALTKKIRTLVWGELMVSISRVV